MMNKRLVCLLLCLMMVATCFVGCSKKTDEEAAANISEEASDSAMTLAMYLLCESEVSPEQAQKIETAVNKITKAKFKTQLKLYFYTADKYYEALEASFAARLAAEEAGTVTNSGEEEGKGEDETFINEEWGITEIKYPTIDSYQVDIFYVGGYDKFTQYNDEGMLSKLDDEVTNDSKLINDYISANYLKFMKKLNSGTYAIPNNTAIGKYQYLLLNKEVLAKTRYNTAAGLAQFNSVTCSAVQSVLEQVKNEYTDYVPFYSSLGVDGLPINNIKYWGVDENGVLSSDFSVLACYGYTDAAYMTPMDSYLGASTNIIGNSTFKNSVKTLKMYEANGYWGTEDDLESGKIAVAYMEGTTDIPVKYADDYVAIPIGAPVMETEDLYKDMFAVSSYTASVNRSMKIITYLNTNEAFRNLLLYGIEGENYELVNSDYLDAEGNPYKVVRRLNNNYMMAPEKTGNTLITYTLEGGNPTLNEYIKLQNSNVIISVTMGFVLDNGMQSVNMDWMNGLRTLSNNVLKLIQDATYEQTQSDEFWSNLYNMVDGDVNYLGSSTVSDESNENDVIGLLQQYQNWAIAMKLYDPEAAE